MHMEHRVPGRRAARAACVAGLITAMALGGTPMAWAASASTEAELSRLDGEVRSATAAFAESSARAQELEAQVDQLADEVIKLEQEILPAQQKLAADAAVNLYKMHSGAAGVLTMLLGAKDISGFIEMGKYLDSIQSTNTRALEDLNELRDELKGKLDDIGAAKDEAMAQQRAADDALGRAKTAQGKMASRAAAEDAEAARRAQEALEAIQQAEQQSRPPAEPETAPDPAPEQKPDPDGGQKPDQGQQGGGNQGGDQGGGQATPDAGWKTGVASYYGIGDGFMGGTTASGEIVTETSMGIAMLNVPFGTRVEIRYGGRSVIAYVNDRGPYVHGRVIDMQPAVARALNFISVGVGTVQYRFL